MPDDLEPVPASSALVMRCSWIEGGWQWTAGGPDGSMLTGGAASEDEAWAKAREAQRALLSPLRPKGSG